MFRFFKKTDKRQSKAHIGFNNPNIADTIRSAQSKNPPTIHASGSTASPNILGPIEQMENDSTAPPPTENDAEQAPPRGQRMNNWMSSTVSIGQDEAYNQARNFLTNDEVGMVGIYGMGGVGKTTLMEKIVGEFLKPSHFEVIWVDVSEIVDMDRIQGVIMGNLNLPFNTHDGLYSRAQKINDALRRNKVVILFDDIWECLDLQKLGILGHANVDTRSLKLIFTTRSEAICKKMLSDKLIRVEPLRWDDSWALFKTSAGISNDIKSWDASIVELAEEVAKECKGLPLALKVIGRAMSWRRLPEEWRDALATLRLYPAKIDDAKKKLFTPLKFSFDSLSNPREKGCFLYTCLYPEDTSLAAKSLIECWIGEGILTLNGSYQEALDEGMSIFRTLQAACLFETLHGGGDEGSSMITRIHDVIRDMGVWIAKSLEMISLPTYSDDGISRAEKTGTHRFSVGYEHSKWPEEAICSNLTTLIIYGKQGGINVSSFASMSKLRVIKLEKVDFDEVPTSIGELTELRHLELIETNLERLPNEIRNLRKLQVMRSNDEWHYGMYIDLPEEIGELIELRILSCSTRNLPIEIGNLHKLEELLIYKSNIKELPKTIGQLTKLTKLEVGDYRLRTLPAEVGNLKKLEELHIILVGFPQVICQLVNLKKLVLKVDGRIELPIGLGNLNKLEIFEVDSVASSHCVELIPNDTFRNMHKLRRLSLPITNFKILPPSFFQGLTSLKSLLVKFHGGDKEECMYDDVASFLTQSSSLTLRILRIFWCPIKKLHVPPTSNTLCLPCLETLDIFGALWLEKMQVTSRMALPSIRVLKFFLCRSLMHISGLEHLQSLVVLEINNCGELEEVIQVAGDETLSDHSTGICFPKLEELWLTNLRRLKSICSDAISFPSLQDFRLDHCPELRVLPRGLVKENKAPKLCFIDGDLEWYDKLQWQDEDFKAALDPHFLFSRRSS